ncbi:MAG: hypothetical protein M0R02_09495 [Bacteroidales bacterium]|nr:hypothetical protein [Bacteroidales bacterium]
MNKSRWAQRARLWHRRLGWVGGFALLLFGLSGLTHPLMTWFGPQAAVFFPPQAHVEIAEIAAIPAILASHGIASAQQVRIVPAADGNKLQVTDADQRRYFEPGTGEERPDFDRQQAEWLARHYTGLGDTPIREMHLQTRFDNAYPEVNRLLPVWRVSFATKDGMTAYVHTELSALAALGNDMRTAQQALFRGLHSFSWLGSWELLRVVVLTVLCLALLGLGLAGAGLVFVLPARHIPAARRRWHRYLALLLWLPLLAFSASGLYHLWHKVAAGADTGFVAAPAMDLRPLWQQGTAVASALQSLEMSAPLNGASLLPGPDGALLLRLAHPAGHQGEHVHRHARFDGTPTERPSHLVALTGSPDAAWSDRSLASHFATAHLGIDQDAITGIELVTAFGPDYDFRNKRLPVWRIRHAGGSAFIDPANGALVDHATTPDRWEGHVFGHLHKWNFLTPWVGRQVRDSLAVLTILLALISATLGMGLQYRRRRAAAAPGGQPIH